MRKLAFIFIPILFSIVTFGQKADLVIITGKFYDSRDSLKKIEAMNAWLTLNDSLIIESRPDSLGEYTFKISRNILNKFKVRLTVFQDQKLLDKIYPINDCPYLRKIPAYYGSQTIKKPDSDIGQIIVNLELSQIYIDYRFPCIRFKKDSVEFSNCGEDNSDTSLFCLRNYLIENPTVTIKVQIHTWNEKCTKQLSVGRGKYILNKLYKLGIDTNRVEIQALGDTKPMVKKEVIKKAPNQADKEALDKINRRATFSIKSWDYVVPTKK